jgi:hypothetical protein
MSDVRVWVSLHFILLYAALFLGDLYCVSLDFEF